MKISIIAAISENNIIGDNGDMPWGRLPVDLEYFKKTTSGNPVIMGRKTYESVGKPLHHRTNIVITRDKEKKIEGVSMANSLEEAIEIAELETPEEIFIIGGGKIYEEALNKNLDKKIYITEIKKEFEGDTRFPEIQKENYIEEIIKETKKDKTNKYDCVFKVYKKI